jgi:hypothetical protein
MGELGIRNVPLDEDTELGVRVDPAKWAVCAVEEVNDPKIELVPAPAGVEG